jgi:CheY-like chemotaxis protein
MWLEGHVDMTRCLIVDDNHDDRLKLAGMLAAYGFELTAATGEQEALEICSRKMPELIVIDEGRTCPDAAAFIRRLGRTAERCPVVIVCPQAREAARIGRTIWGGAAECMMKPYDAEILDLKLRQTGII